MTETRQQAKKSGDLHRPGRGTVEEEHSDRKPDLPAVFRLVSALLRPHRGFFLVGIALMLLNKVSGLILPATTRYVVDVIVARHDVSKLPVVVAIALAATFLQGISSFGMAQLLSKG